MPLKEVNRTAHASEDAEMQFRGEEAAYLTHCAVRLPETRSRFELSRAESPVSAPCPADPGVRRALSEGL